MKHVKRLLGLGIAGLGAWGGAVACAGGDTPRRTPEVLEGLAQYAEGAVPPVGAAGMGMGMGMSGAGGESGSGGDGNDPGGAGGELPSGGAAGSGSASGMAGSGGAAGSGGDDPPGNEGGCDGFAILQTSCNGGTCHGAGTFLTPFAADEAAVADFVDAPSGACGGEILLVPDEPEDSLIILKMRGMAPCGSPMPPPSGGLSEEDIACVEEWIGSL